MARGSKWRLRPSQRRLTQVRESIEIVCWKLATSLMSPRSHNPKVAGSNPAPAGSEDQLQNLRAVREDMRVFSAHELRDGTRIWIITEADRSVTTILLPEEY